MSGNRCGPSVHHFEHSMYDASGQSGPLVITHNMHGKLRRHQSVHTALRNISNMPVFSNKCAITRKK